MASYALKRITDPTFQPITLDEAKLHLRVDGTEEDSLIEAQLAAAVDYASGYTGRSLATASYRLTMDGPPIGRIGAPRLHPEVEIPVQIGQGFFRVTLARNSIRLPLPPLISVEAIRYRDPAGVMQTLDPAAYVVDTESEPGRVVVMDGWPAMDNRRPGALTIEFTAGYAQGKIPPAIRAAMLMHLGKLYDTRAPETGYVQLAAVDNLLWQYRVF